MARSIKEIDQQERRIRFRCAEIARSRIGNLYRIAFETVREADCDDLQ